MRKSFFAKIAASAVAFTVVCLPPATNSSATSCDDIKFIFARGSGQKLEDEDYLAFKTAITNELSNRKPNLKWDFYELGSSSEYGAKYPAIALSFFTVLGAKVSAGNAFAFSESVRQGIIELKNYTEQVSASCPETRFVMAGYSQGAMLITKSLSELNSDKFIYAATFGDPKLYLPEGKGVMPEACRGRNFSTYRIFAPNCYTYQGALSAKIPYLENGWQTKVGLWCKDQDLVCGAGFSFGTPKTTGSPLENLIQSALHAHTRYPDDNIYNLAAKTIVDKIHLIYPTTFGAKQITGDKQDTVIIINYSAMYKFIDYYRKVASVIAEETINSGGRVALWTYDDTNEGKKILGFTTDFKEFSAHLWQTGGSAGGSKERPDAFLSAVQNLVETTRWNKSAPKAIVILTQSPLRNPDQNGVSGDSLIESSSQEGPINIYAISEFEEYIETYAKLARETGGDAFWGLDVSNVIIPDTWYVRPEYNLPLREYQSKPNEILTFEAESPDDAIKYEWDLDFDGTFETETTEPMASMSYPNDVSGYVTLKTTHQDDSSSYTAFKVVISSSMSLKTPSLENLKVTQNGSSVTISCDFGEDTIGMLVAIDDAPLGITAENNLEITNVVKNTTLTITPVSENGTFSAPISGDVIQSSPENILPSTPETGRR